MVAKLCSRSHGHPVPGVRSAAMMSISAPISREGFIAAPRALAIPISWNIHISGRENGPFQSPARTPLCWRFRDLNPEPVVGGLDVWRQLAAQLFVIEVGVHVGEDRALRLDLFDPVQRVAQREVTWVRPIAQRVKDPYVEPLEQRHARGRKVAHVGRISQVSEAKAERVDLAVHLRKWKRGYGAGIA